MEKKVGPTEFQAEVERLKAAGKLPSHEDLLEAMVDTRGKFRDKILEARKSGEEKEGQ